MPSPVCEWCGEPMYSSYRLLEEDEPVADVDGKLWRTWKSASRWYYGCKKHDAWQICDIANRLSSSIRMFGRRPVLEWLESICAIKAKVWLRENDRNQESPG